MDRKVTRVRLPVLPLRFLDSVASAVLAPVWKTGDWCKLVEVRLLQSPPGNAPMRLDREQNSRFGGRTSDHVITSTQQRPSPDKYLALAQMEECNATNVEVAGSIPAGGSRSMQRHVCFRLVPHGRPGAGVCAAPFSNVSTADIPSHGGLAERPKALAC